MATMDLSVLATLPLPLRQKVELCQDQLRKTGKLVVAFSGGVDSTFLLALAAGTLGAENVLAACGVSPSFSARERQEAKDLAGCFGVRLVEVETGEMDNPQYTANPANRCFYCKHDLLRRLQELGQREGFANVVTGANADDTGDFRPGLQAGRELGVGNPLMDAGLTKADIRAASKALGLPTWDKPAYACLASRIPYGQTITTEKLSRIEQAEYVLRDLGFHSCRVRYHGVMARIEVPAEQLDQAVRQRELIVEPLKKLGFNYVALDLQGFRSGSMNETL